MNLDDDDFTFCKKAGTKLSALVRLPKVLKSKTKNFNEMFEAQIS